MHKTLILPFLLPIAASAQPIGSLTIGQYCSYNSTPLPGKLITFSSDTNAKTAIARIMAQTSLPSRFRIMAADIPSAAAVLKDKQRYILYNELLWRR